VIPGATRTSLAAAAALVLLVALLAALQYRWIGEIRDAERDRMRASARAASAAVAADLDRELARALRFFGEPLRPDRGDGQKGPGLVEAWSRWKSEAKLPELVSDVALARRETGGAWRIDRLDPASGTLRAAAWTPDLEPVRRALDGQAGAPPALPLPLHDAPPGSVGRWPHRIPFFHVFDEPPVLVVGSEASPGDDGGSGPALRAVLVRLDTSQIAGRLLPELVARHFGDSAQYDVALVSRSGGAPLYRSRADYDPARHAPDAAVPIFPVPFGRFGPESERPPENRRDGLHRDFLFRVHPGPEAQAPWTLVAAHRAGSLDAAVGAARVRNLAVSGAILVLLLIAGGMLLASAHRSARLARQQVEFVASLTHELRTPLAAIRTAGENLSDGVIADAGRVRAYGDLIQREGRRLSTLIEDSLAQAGIEARGEGVRAGSASLPEAVAEAIEACRPLARARGASVEASLPADLPAVAGDEPAVRTLIENLLSNAIKYGGENGRVTVSAGSDASHVRVAVHDRGPGIPDADLPRIFEPFYRGSGTGADGSGLGLALVRRIVEALGGRIAVESRPSDGTTFTILLPRAPQAQPERA
jgi:signal transduction histidine kinase